MLQIVCCHHFNPSLMFQGSLLGPSADMTIIEVADSDKHPSLEYYFTIVNVL